MTIYSDSINTTRSFYCRLIKFIIYVNHVLRKIEPALGWPYLKEDYLARTT